jgi:hypothetical protein
MNSPPLFLNLVEREIAHDFFNSLLSHKDLISLLGTCSDMKNMIRKWKSIFPIIDLKLIQTTDSKLNYLVNYYSKDVKNLQIQFNKLTNHGYHILSLFNLQELNIDNCSGDGIQIISNSLKNLSKLKIIQSLLLSNADLDSLAKLTNLEELTLSVEKLGDDAVVNYSSLTKMRSLKFLYCRGITGIGLSYLERNKEFLVKLEISKCYGIAKEGYHCLSTLTNLTYLNIYSSRLDDIGLNLICSSCLLVEHLGVGQELDHHLEPHFGRGSITVEDGFSHIHFLTNLKSLTLYRACDDWIKKLSDNFSLTSLDLRFNTISVQTINEQLPSLFKLTNLKSIKVNGKELHVSWIKVFVAARNNNI